MMQPSLFKPILILLFTGLFCLGIQRAGAQDGEKTRIPDKLDTIRNTESLFYYGVDFSHLRVSDGSKILKSYEYRRHYPDAWFAFLDKEIGHFNRVGRELRKETLYYKQNEILPVSRNMVNDFIIAGSYSFPLDTVKYALKQYQLNEKEGLGLVLIPENFNKREEQARMWVVFFNIQSREVLWATEVYGKCGGAGYTTHWGSGIVDGFKKFIRKVYRVPRFPMYDNF